MINRVWTWTRRLILYPLLAVAMIIGGGVVWLQATLYRASDPQQGVLALVGATALVGPDLRPVTDATVVIQHGRIIAVGADVDVPPGADIVQVQGRTVLPGLIDSHVHLGNPEMERGEQGGPGIVVRSVTGWLRHVAPKRRALLEHGVTSVRSMGDDPTWIREMRRRVADGELEGPRVFAAGPIFTAPGGHPLATIGAAPEDDFVRLPASPDEARTMVENLVRGDDPVDLIKVVQDRGDPRRLVLEPIRTDILNAIVEAAHAHDVPVFAHWGTAQDLKELLDAGVDGVDHLEPRGVGAGWDPDLRQRAIDAGVTLAPTLAVTEVAVPGDTGELLQRRTLEFHQAGGTIIAASDAGMPGVYAGESLIRELELLVQAGLSPREALVAATSTPARSIGADHIGVIAPGRSADLLVVDGDPLADLAAVRDVHLVVRDGRVVVDRR